MGSNILFSIHQIISHVLVENLKFIAQKEKNQTNS